MVITIGIDAGGTLTKIAYYEQDGTLHVQHYPSTDLAQVAAFIEAHPHITTIGMTGGRAEQLNTLLADRLTRHFLVEFEATLRGVNEQLKQQNSDLARCIITNIGSGTSIHYKNGDVVTKNIDMTDYIEYLETSLTKIRKHVNKLEVQVV